MPGLAPGHTRFELYCRHEPERIMGSDHLITTIEDLEKVYGSDVYPPARAKETDRIIPAYCKLIEAAPFFALASNGPGGLDCSPRGDPAGFVKVADEKTLL